MTSIIERAPAKLNLVLEVTGRRPDGYHEIATVFQTIDLCDIVEIEPGDDLELECDQSELLGERNLVYRAAQSLREAAGTNRGARLRLMKHIPVAAGLGGGSADAAATLRGLARLWCLSDSIDLPAIAARLGADVPFLVRGGTAFARGIGDQIEWLPAGVAGWAVLLTPMAGAEDKTARAYRALSPADWSDGAAAAGLAGQIRAGGDVDLAAAPNTFERVADELFPGLADWRDRLLAAGAPWVRLAGAGPSLFTIVGDRARAIAIAAELPPSAQVTTARLLTGD